MTSPFNIKKFSSLRKSSANLIAPAVPSGVFSSVYWIFIPSLSPSPKYALNTSLITLTANIISFIPADFNNKICRSITGLLTIGIKDLGIVQVKGRKRVPQPPDIIIPFVIVKIK